MLPQRSTSVKKQRHESPSHEKRDRQIKERRQTDVKSQFKDFVGDLPPLEHFYGHTQRQQQKCHGHEHWRQRGQIERYVQQQGIDSPWHMAALRQYFTDAENVVEVKDLKHRNRPSRHLVGKLRSTEKAIDRPINHTGERTDVVPHIAVEHKAPVHLLAHQHPAQFRDQQRHLAP